AEGKTLPPHRVAARLSSTHAVVSAIAAGLGIGFVSAAAIAGRRAEVSPVRIRGLPLRRDLYAVFVRDRLTTRLLREFAHFVESWNQQGESSSTGPPTRVLDPSLSDG
ncbi:MAG: hypothetical protein HY329_01550, partial [Chloroflexi bacterium]|nr:hypothetical protein [Chloroflexota bacterium]